MIVGDIRHFEEEKHVYPAAVRKGIEHILNGRLADRAPGTYELDGRLMFALVQEMQTRPADELRFESHATYVDIQFLVSGEERIEALKHSAGLKIAENELETGDIVFYEPDSAKATSIMLNPGQFAVFYPSDVHRPCCIAEKPEPIKKIVIKIHKRLWQD